MDINGLIEQYGYAALVVGSVAEGETITLLGGVAAHQGLLKFPLVAAAVALGGMIGDQLLYFLGLRFGPALLQRFAKHQKKIPQSATADPAPPLPVCDWHPLYVRLSNHRADIDWGEPPAAENFPAAQYCWRCCLGADLYDARLRRGRGDRSVAA